MAEVVIPSVSWGRAVLATAALSLAGQVLIFLRRGALNPPMAIAMSVGLLLIFAFRSRTPLVLRAGTLSGLGPLGLRSVRIPLNEIDHARSAQVGWFGARRIWSRTGQALHLDSTVIPKAHRERLLAAVGLQQLPSCSRTTPQSPSARRSWFSRSRARWYAETYANGGRLLGCRDDNGLRPSDELPAFCSRWPQPRLASAPASDGDLFGHGSPGHPSIEPSWTAAEPL
jgi:hypothetical protein